jgi:hypothetical protein
VTIHTNRRINSRTRHAHQTQRRLFSATFKRYRARCACADLPFCETLAAALLPRDGHNAILARGFSPFFLPFLN